MEQQGITGISAAHVIESNNTTNVGVGDTVASSNAYVPMDVGLDSSPEQRDVDAITNKIFRVWSTTLDEADPVIFNLQSAVWAIPQLINTLTRYIAFSVDSFQVIVDIICPTNASRIVHYGYMPGFGVDDTGRLRTVMSDVINTSSSNQLIIDCHPLTPYENFAVASVGKKLDGSASDKEFECASPMGYVYLSPTTISSLLEPTDTIQVVFSLKLQGCKLSGQVPSALYADFFEAFKTIGISYESAEAARKIFVGDSFDPTLFDKMFSKEPFPIAEQVGVKPLIMVNNRDQANTVTTQSGTTLLNLPGQMTAFPRDDLLPIHSVPDTPIIDLVSKFGHIGTYTLDAGFTVIDKIPITPVFRTKTGTSVTTPLGFISGYFRHYAGDIEHLFCVNSSQLKKFTMYIVYAPTTFDITGLTDVSQFTNKKVTFDRQIWSASVTVNQNLFRVVHPTYHASDEDDLINRTRIMNTGINNNYSLYLVGYGNKDVAGLQMAHYVRAAPNFQLGAPKVPMKFTPRTENPGTVYDSYSYVDRQNATEEISTTTPEAVEQHDEPESSSDEEEPLPTPARDRYYEHVRVHGTTRTNEYVALNNAAVRERESNALIVQQRADTRSKGDSSEGKAEQVGFAPTMVSVDTTVEQETRTATTGRVYFTFGVPMKTFPASWQPYTFLSQLVDAPVLLNMQLNDVKDVFSRYPPIPMTPRLLSSNGHFAVCAISDLFFGTNFAGFQVASLGDVPSVSHETQPAAILHNNTLHPRFERSFTDINTEAYRIISEGYENNKYVALSQQGSFMTRYFDMNYVPAELYKDIPSFPRGAHLFSTALLIDGLDPINKRVLNKVQLRISFFPRYCGFFGIPTATSTKIYGGLPEVGEMHQNKYWYTVPLRSDATPFP